MPGMGLLLRTYMFLFYIVTEMIILLLSSKEMYSSFSFYVIMSSCNLIDFFKLFYLSDFIIVWLSGRYQIWFEISFSIFLFCFLIFFIYSCNHWIIFIFIFNKKKKKLEINKKRRIENDIKVRIKILFYQLNCISQNWSVWDLYKTVPC